MPFAWFKAKQSIALLRRNPPSFRPSCVATEGTKGFFPSCVATEGRFLLPVLRSNRRKVPSEGRKAGKKEPSLPFPFPSEGTLSLSLSLRRNPFPFPFPFPTGREGKGREGKGRFLRRGGTERFLRLLRRTDGRTDGRRAIDKSSTFGCYLKQNGCSTPLNSYLKQKEGPFRIILFY
jgi:hypothetical protein